MEIREAIRTTGAVRSFTDEPVDAAVLAEILDDARYAPSGGNRQPWKVAVIQNPDLRRTISSLMRGVMQDYFAIGATGRTPFNALDPDSFQPQHETGPETPFPLVEQIEKAPIVLAIAADLAKVAMMDYGNPVRPPVTAGGSVYPFCWSILLSARAHGLGGVMTTFLSRVESHGGAALGLPSGHALAATIVIGHPVHQATKLKRRPVSAFATLDRFDGETFGG